MFQFKQFKVDQTNCAMKINTDGVLLGALAEAETPAKILDIGTGTGVIALMLAQRFEGAQIDAVEIDELAAETAKANFSNSIFSKRLTAYPLGFEEFFEEYPEVKYDLIVSNPPFYINSLLSLEEKKQLAKHADQGFFREMLSSIASHLSTEGECCLVLPVDTSNLVRNVCAEFGLRVIKTIYIRSFSKKIPHREIIVLSCKENTLPDDEFVIYRAEGNYSEQYIKALKQFFTVF